MCGSCNNVLHVYGIYTSGEAVWPTVYMYQNCSLVLSERPQAMAYFEALLSTAMPCSPLVVYITNCCWAALVAEYNASW